MTPLHVYLAYFVGGVALANAVPHLVSGMMGRPFQSPFANPPGQGLSSSTVNVLWGSFNIALAYVLLVQVGSFDLYALDDVIAAGLGGVVMGITLARRFGRFHGGNNPLQQQRPDESG